MTIFPIGLVITLVSFYLSIRFLHQTASNYYDAVALFIVFGGTIGVFLIVTPWDLRKEVMHAVKRLWVKNSLTYKSVLSDCMGFLQQGSDSVKGLPPTAPDHMKLLADGIELWDLGFKADRIENILADRLVHQVRRQRRIANALKGLAKYPPAFGLMGTVLGLVNVMRGVSTGMSGQQTALEMAVALVATMYGLIVSNLVINPSGELTAKYAQEQEIYGEIVISTFRLWAQKTSLLEAQETLNSFVPAEQRLNFGDISLGDMSA